MGEITDLAETAGWRVDPNGKGEQPDDIVFVNAAGERLTAFIEELSEDTTHIGFRGNPDFVDVFDEGECDYWLLTQGEEHRKDCEECAEGDVGGDEED